ncbi:hypothetical protein [Aliarcobacter thereius]|uniref:Plasminogen-binding protein PgbB n=2 Tax=Aliarcobacter thereius TaxID=544718 RepID=A0A1C0B8G6_9BACT|nr:hypothetical protein [Aliarcobacter thereius]OCL93803.1 Plasminogen-binding protein PgbB [Aliarcobacter thereius]OCL95211.1 Plasminogen-binding protein PgbB [Aliarcobacter thereius LMG 24486]OCL99895.1 Plasminogen-binding protein PgbB [Aliarcobacter thereius]QBF16799.1 hypothetical protein ATH_1782 [Aliarcobacter thereius LMG 24486]TLS94172.1 hypothetical protein FE244_02540 [Aliarcobacter thereius]
MKYRLYLVLFIFLISGCSGKKYYEPTDVEGEFEVSKKSMKSYIKSMNKIGGTLENGVFVSELGLSEMNLAKDFNFINLSDDKKIIATNNLDKILIDNIEINTENPVIAASLVGDRLAVIYSNNSVELFDINSNKTLFKEYFSLSLANDVRVTNPVFMGSLVLFPTLDGRLIIVSLVSNEIVRNIAVDPDNEFKNIIALGLLNNDETLIVASSNKILSISPRDTISKEYNIRDIIFKEDKIYLANIEGEIIKMNSSLDEESSIKLKYAKILALAYSESLYALESQGFLINLDKNLDSEKVYKFYFDNEKRVLSIDNKLYFDKNYIELP